jgi:HEPN domain-containing protein
MTMRFTSEHYYRTALERMEQARLLYNQGRSYALAMYVSGVAAECILRAFKLLRDPEFDERHDLLRLFKASGMISFDPAVLRARGLTKQQSETFRGELRSAVNEAYILWANDYRFASEVRLRVHLRRISSARGVKGDLLKAEALRLYNAAHKFVEIGILLWRASNEAE